MRNVRQRCHQHDVRTLSRTGWGRDSRLPAHRYTSDGEENDRARAAFHRAPAVKGFYRRGGGGAWLGKSPPPGGGGGGGGRGGGPRGGGGGRARAARAAPRGARG